MTSQQKASISGRETLAAVPARAPVLLHVGYHKSGSTWLQQTLFEDERAGFLSRRDAPRHRLVEEFVVPDPLGFDPAPLADRFASAIDDARAAGRTFVLSHERFSGYPSSGGRDRGLIAERLAAVFPEARILIVIREQRSLIRSMYSQHVTDGGVESVGRFLRTPEPGLMRKPSFGLACYEFDLLVETYQRLFGRDRVLVLPVEMLASDPAGFAGAIAGFCGHEPPPLEAVRRANTARPLLMQQVQRPLNFLFYHNELSPGALIHVPRFHKRYARLRRAFELLSPRWLEARLDRRLRQRIEAFVGEHYAASNSRTERLIGRSLGQFGYPTAAG